MHTKNKFQELRIRNKELRFLVLPYFFILTSVLFVFSPVMAAAKDNVVKDAFGVNTHLRQRYPQSDWDTILDHAQTSGVQWNREQFNWDVIEPTDGEFSYDAYDNVMQAYQEHDMDVLGLLTYSSSWASENPGSTEYEFYPPNIVAWEDYVEHVAEHYAGQITYWEIWNEPNHSGFWKGSVDDYVNLVETAINAIHNGNPDAKVVLGGVSGADYDFINQVLSKLTDPTDIDVVAIHPYRTSNGSFNFAPEDTAPGMNTLVTDILNVKTVLKRHGLHKTPIWITEMGWTTGNDGVSFIDQANYLTRAYTIALAIPRVQKVFWYAMADTAEDEAVTDSQFGLLEDDYLPKLSLNAFKFVAEELSGKWLKDQQLPQTQVVDNFTKGLGWEFTDTVCTTGSLNDHDQTNLFVRYQFVGNNNCYAPIRLNKALPNGTQAIQFKVKGDNNSTLLRVRITDATGETLQYNLGYMPGDWNYQTVQLDQPSAHWNGDNDGKLDQPLKFDSFVIDDTDNLKESGTVRFAALSATTQANIYQYRFHQGTKDVYAVWSAGKNRKLYFLLSGVGKLTEHIWRYEDISRTSGNGYFNLRAREAVTFLQTR